MYLVQQGGAKSITFNAVRFRSFELVLNYHEILGRYLLQHLAKRGATAAEMDARYGRFYELLITVIIPEKRRQMNFKNASAWPDSIPWSVRNVWTMPVVLWIYKEVPHVAA